VSADVLARLAAVERRVRAAVAERRRGDPHPDDPYRGLYLTDDAVAALLETPRKPFPAPSPAGAGNGRLAELAAGARLSELDVDLLLVALAPDVDSRFEQLYGYLNDDVTRRRATIGLALRLCGIPEPAAGGRSRLAAGAPLVDTGLLAVEEPERPFLSRSLRAPDRVVAHLLGDDTPDAGLAGVVAVAPSPAGLPEARPVVRAIEAGLVYLVERPGAGAAALAAAAFAETGARVLRVDGERLRADPSPAARARVVAREALLRRAGVVVGPLDGDWPRPVLEALRRAGPVVGYGPHGWDPRWSTEVPVQLEAVALPVAVRARLWRAAVTGPLASDVDPGVVTAHFVLGPDGIDRAARAAMRQAGADGGFVRAEHLCAGARTQNAAGLQRLARRVEPAVGWDDLVLPPAVLAQLHELAARARHRDLVLGDWRMRPGGGRGRGVTALFGGESGTGKTMSAEVVAAELGLDLYTVDLATVVDKYVGETEKNLDRIFTEAAGVNGVLLFDEADALFGRRSEVRDAHDRYANLESAYLLQRMEAFDGLAVLSTNLRANLDEAFTRRLDLVVDFPLPDQPARRALWDRCLGTALTRSSDVDLDYLAVSFELAGGHIRSAAITAAYLAADAGAPVCMADLIGAVAREYRKLGRLCLEREFGPYLELVLMP
jgi:winged helix domain-containing protein/ATPase family protein associated with various cellular activities (AAA)